VALRQGERAGAEVAGGVLRRVAAMSARDLIMAISDGKVAQRKVSVVPGLRIEQVAARVEKAGLSDAKSILAEAHAKAFTARCRWSCRQGGRWRATSTRRPTASPWASRRTISPRNARGFQSNFATKYSADIAKTGLGLHKIVTLASLIEREAKADAERPIIAGVIMNRLRQKMKLQIDATVLYALGHHKTRVLVADLSVSSPYNTYLYPGLPPGPICSPGMASLLAAVHPATTPYLFYVANGRARTSSGGPLRNTWPTSAHPRGAR